MWEAARHWQHDHDVTVIASDIDETSLEGVTTRRVATGGTWSFAKSARATYSVEEFDHVISFGAQAVPATVLWVNSVHRAWLQASTTFAGESRVRNPRLRYLMPDHLRRLAVERSYYRADPPPRLAVVVADAVGDDLVRLYGMDPVLIETIHNGFDPAEFDPSRRTHEGAASREQLGLPHDAVVLTMVANELVRKGFDVLLQAMARSAPPAHLVLAGTADPAGHAALIDRLGLTNRVHYVGPQGDVGRLHSVSDVFVLPTKYEAFCLAIVEALASGVPVVTTTVPGAGDLVQDGVNGLLQHRPDDPAELASLLTRMMDARTRQRMSDAARPSVDRLTWANLFDEAAELLRTH